MELSPLLWHMWVSWMYDIFVFGKSEYVNERTATLGGDTFCIEEGERNVP